MPAAQKTSRRRHEETARDIHERTPTFERQRPLPKPRVRPLLPLTESKKPPRKPSKAPRSLEKGSTPRKEAEPEEDGQWDEFGLQFTKKREEALRPGGEDLRAAGDAVPQSKENETDRHDSVHHLQAENGHRSLPERSHEVMPIQQLDVTVPDRRRSSHRASGTPSDRNAPSLKHGKKHDNRDDEVIPDIISRPLTRRESRVFVTQPIASSPLAAYGHQHLSGEPVLSHVGRRADKAYLGGYVEIRLGSPTPPRHVPQPRPKTYPKRQAVQAGLPVLAGDGRRRGRSDGRPAPQSPAARIEQTLTRRPAARHGRFVTKRTYEVMDDPDGHDHHLSSHDVSRPSDMRVDVPQLSGDDRSSRASGIESDDLLTPSDARLVPQTRQSSHSPLSPYGGHRKRAKTNDGDKQGVHHLASAERARRRSSSDDRSTRHSLHPPSSDGTERSWSPKPLSSILDPRMFCLGRAVPRPAGESYSEEEDLQRYGRDKNKGKTRTAVAATAGSSVGQLKLSRNRSVVDRLEQYNDKIRKERRAHCLSGAGSETLSKHIIPSPKSPSARSNALTRARNLPLSAFKSRTRKAATDTTGSGGKGFDAIDPNLVSAGNKDLLDRMLASGAKKSKGGGGAGGKKRPQPTPHHQHLYASSRSTHHRQDAEGPEPITEFAPSLPCTQQAPPSCFQTPPRSMTRVKPGQLTFVNGDSIVTGERAAVSSPITRVQAEAQTYEKQWETERLRYLHGHPPSEVRYTALPSMEDSRGILDKQYTVQAVNEPPQYMPVTLSNVISDPVATAHVAQRKAPASAQQAPPIQAHQAAAGTLAPIKEPVNSLRTEPNPDRVPPYSALLPLPMGRPPLAEITAANVAANQTAGENTLADTMTSSSQLLRSVDDMLAVLPMSDADAERLASELDDMLDEHNDEEIHGDDRFDPDRIGTGRSRRHQGENSAAGLSGADMTDHLLHTLKLFDADQVAEIKASATKDTAAAEPGTDASAKSAITTPAKQNTSDRSRTAKTMSSAKSNKAKPRRRKAQAASASVGGKGTSPPAGQGRLNFHALEPPELDSQIPKDSMPAQLPTAFGDTLTTSSNVFMGIRHLDTIKAPEPTPQVIWTATPAVQTQQVPSTMPQGIESVREMEYELAEPHTQHVATESAPSARQPSRDSRPPPARQRSIAQENGKRKANDPVGPQKKLGRPTWVTDASAQTIVASTTLSSKATKTVGHATSESPSQSIALGLAFSEAAETAEKRDSTVTTPKRKLRRLSSASKTPTSEIADQEMCGVLSPTQIGTTPRKSSGGFSSFASEQFQSDEVQLPPGRQPPVYTERKRRSIILAKTTSQSQASEEDELLEDSCDESNADAARARSTVASPAAAPYAVKRPTAAKSIAQHGASSIGAPSCTVSNKSSVRNRRDYSSSDEEEELVQVTTQETSELLRKRPTYAVKRTASCKSLGIRPYSAWSRTSSRAEPSAPAGSRAARAPFKPPSRTPSFALSLAPEPSAGGQRALNTWELEDSDPSSDQAVDDY